MVWVRFASDIRQVRGRALGILSGSALLTVALQMLAHWDGGLNKSYGDGRMMRGFLILGPALIAFSGSGLLVDVGLLPRAWVRRRDYSVRLTTLASACRGESLFFSPGVPVRLDIASKPRSGVLLVGSRVTFIVTAAGESVSMAVVTSDQEAAAAKLLSRLRAAGLVVE